MDLSRPEVASWIESQIERLITQYKLDMFRIDHNHNIGLGGTIKKHGYTENVLWRYYESLYQIFDRLRAKFPKVVFQNCAGGGGRLDLRILQRFHNTEISDWMRQPRRFTNCCHSDYTVLPRSLFAINNLTIAYPPEVFKYYFGHWPGYHLYGDFDFQIRTAMFSNPLFVGFWPKSDAVNESEKSKIMHYISLYKDFIKPMIPNIQVYHHTQALDFNSAHGWCVLEYAAADRSKSYAGVFRIQCVDGNSYTYKPKGLSPDSIYKVTSDNSGMSFSVPGWELMQKGITVEIDVELHSELLLFEKVQL